MRPARPSARGPAVADPEVRRLPRPAGDAERVAQGTPRGRREPRAAPRARADRARLRRPDQRQGASRRDPRRRRRRPAEPASGSAG